MERVCVCVTFFDTEGKKGKTTFYRPDAHQSPEAKGRVDPSSYKVLQNIFASSAFVSDTWLIITILTTKTMTSYGIQIWILLD